MQENRILKSYEGMIKTQEVRLSTARDQIDEAVPESALKVPCERVSVPRISAIPYQKGIKRALLKSTAGHQCQGRSADTRRLAGSG